MERQFSSRWTFWFKYVQPVLWIWLFGSGAWAESRDPRGRGWVIGAAWLAGSAVMLWLALPLKRVRVADDGALRVSNYWRESVVPLALVADVRQNRWVNPRPIRVRLKAEVPGVGTGFSFIPPTRWRLAAWREDREVAELREMAGLGPVRGAPAA